MNKQIFIAEIKTLSPFGFKSNYRFDFLSKLAITYGDWISVHTSPLWGGGFDDIVRIKRQKNTDQKILAKGIHETDEEIERALSAEANYVLVVGRVPPDKYLPYCLLEPIDFKQAVEFSKVSGIAGIVFNKRSLINGSHINPVEYWVKLQELLENKTELKIFQASLIKTFEDVRVMSDGYIVGENLPSFILSQRIKKLMEDFNVKANI